MGIELETFGGTGPMLCQLSYVVKSVRVGDISELSLKFLRYKCILRYDFFMCVGVMYSGEYDVCDVALSASHTQSNITNI